jgi:molecular chaperone HscB
MWWMLLSQPAAMNYFEIFGIPVSYNVDESRLTEIYLRKQSSLHPDVAGAASNAESSALLNAAYGTLRDPIKRAEYLLALDGTDVTAVSSDEVTLRIFELQEKWTSLCSEDEKMQFCNDLRKKMSDLIGSLRRNEKNPGKFRQIFCELRFLDAFLGRVTSDDDGSDCTDGGWD